MACLIIWRHGERKLWDLRNGLVWFYFEQLAHSTKISIIDFYEFDVSGKQIALNQECRIIIQVILAKPKTEQRVSISLYWSNNVTIDGRIVSCYMILKFFTDFKSNTAANRLQHVRFHSQAPNSIQIDNSV
jgi:hypothetical protein